MKHWNPLHKNSLPLDIQILKKCKLSIFKNKFDAVGGRFVGKSGVLLIWINKYKH